MDVRRALLVGTTAAVAVLGLPSAALAAEDDRLVITVPGNVGVAAYTVQADGGERRDLVLSPGTGASRGPRWTADGSAVVFVSFDHRDSTCCDVQVSDQEGRGVRTVATTDQVEQEPVVSPDAARIGWLDGPADGEVLVTARPDGADQTRVRLPHSAVSHAAWSPDGHRIAYTAGAINRDPRAYVAALDGTDAVEVAAGAYVQQWSPRGDALLTVRHGSGRSQTVVVAADGSGERLVVDDAYPHVWTPDGASIAVTRGRDLLLVDATSGAERLLYSVPEGEQARIDKVAITPDGAQVALSYEYGSDISQTPTTPRSPVVVVDVATGAELHRIGEPTRYDTQFSFSPLPTSPRQGRSLDPACADHAAPYGFTDVEPSVHRAAIDCLAHRGVLRGTSPDTFSPDQPVTRGQIALMLARLAASDGAALDTSDAGFRDLDGQSDEARDAINAMANAGVISGYSSTVFGPGVAASRAQMASLLERFQRLLVGSPFPYRGNCFFDDAGLNHEASIDALCGARVVTGTDGRGRFTPDSELSRAQIASFLARLLAANEDEAEPESASP